MNKIELSSRAMRDVKSRSPRDRAHLLSAIADTLKADELSPNADVKALTGRSPWRRLRVGQWRVLYRPCATAERREILVARVVNRRDLDRAVGTL